MTPRILLLAAFAGLLLIGIASARTWYVAADGSGDAPTIDAAVDSSSAGDVILVGPGTHLVGSGGLGALYLKPGTTLQSELGPMVTALVPYEGPAQPGMVAAFDACVIKGFHIAGANSSTISVLGENAEIAGNVIEASVQTVTIDGVASIHHNVIYGGGAGAIGVQFSEGITHINNNIILGRISECGGDVLVYCNDVTVASSCVSYGQTNFNLDPMFCGIDNYYLNAASACAPGNHPNGYDNCGLIGPLPVGCGTVRTEQTTWGAVKALYRN